MLRMTGDLLLFAVETYPDFRQRQGCGYDFTFLRKRENDFTILIESASSAAVSEAWDLTQAAKEDVDELLAAMDKFITKSIQY